MMNFPTKFWKTNFPKIGTLLLLAGAASAQVGHQNVVQKISLGTSNPFQLQVQTNVPVTPQAQIISDPERLVIDIPNSLPGPGLRDQSIHRDEVSRIRVGLFSSTPPVTRIVLDLNAPQWYRIEPVGSGFTVTLG